MKIAVSACLLGRICNYICGNNRSQAVLDFLKVHVVIPVCPEVTGGLPVPRVPAELQNGRAVNKNGEDVTAYFRRGVEQTTGSQLPGNFQRAEFLREHGFVDAVIERRALPVTLGNLLYLHGG